jgi:hypothetical protein
MYNRNVRSTFFCVTCKRGMSLADADFETLYGLPHAYEKIREEGFPWAMAAYCPTCKTPLFTRRKHLIREQRVAFKRHNGKARKKNGNQTRKSNHL